ncbi:MAG: tRNA (guanosine(46)-N7)-methyltransferase TrmB [Bacteroidota bacterium]|nr:tRNA (guanosine(46)-N7)-methyltransferase TrmB [Bacteroidota bacterium]
MGKHKLQRFAEMKNMPHVLEPGIEESINVDYKLKGKWKKEFFGNNKDIIIELGCGKGEYTNFLAKAFPENNYIGIDIKGARMWRGAKTAIEENITNVAFLRTRIEWIGSFFDNEEIAEIWITFPDPQLKMRRTKKRLTSPGFLNMYKSFLQTVNKVHLKTDSRELYEYTRELLNNNSIEIKEDIEDLYSAKKVTTVLTTKTHYETLFLNEGKKITYLQFSLDKNKNYV